MSRLLDSRGFLTSGGSRYGTRPIRMTLGTLDRRGQVRSHPFMRAFITLVCDNVSEHIALEKELCRLSVAFLPVGSSCNAPTGLHGGWLPYHPTARLLLRIRGPQHFRTGTRRIVREVNQKKPHCGVLPASFRVAASHTILDYLPDRLTAAIAVLSAPFLMSFSTSGDAMSASC